jgi:hypothetical protein
MLWDCGGDGGGPVEGLGLCLSPFMGFRWAVSLPTLSIMVG